MMATQTADIVNLNLLQAFKTPGDHEWCPLVVQGDSTDDSTKASKSQVESNKEKLKDVLLAAFQMQHLVVLAGSGCSLSAGGPSMDTLWNSVVEAQPEEAERVGEKVNHRLDEKNIEVFLSRIEAYLLVNDDKEVAAFLNKSKKAIIHKCSGFFRTEDLKSHITFLHRLSRRRSRDPRLKVFTTNYDLCFETAASEQGIVALDGFSFATPRRYDPRFYSYDIVRRPLSGDDLGSYLEGVFLLYKLHGSVNWARRSDGTVIEKPNPRPEEACLIYPAVGKYQQSFTQPYLESMAHYLGAIREPNTCMIVVGFGFNDNHLAEPLLAAARSNPHLRLIIVDPGAKQKSCSGNRFWRAFAQLSAEGEDVWLIALSFEEFAQMIPDLKSLTPAEDLMKAIRGVIKESNYSV